jgi:hypothetical protein
MKLNDLDKKNFANQALKDNYKFKINLDKLNMLETRNMLKKVRSLALETKQTTESYDNLTNPSYMKLVFLEEALVNHYNSLSQNRPQIVVENEEVDKSQVVLAAQDMVDTVQKMIENVSDMLVKELPALTDSIQSEIGVNESQQFNQQVTEALKGLQDSLTQSQGTLKNALGVITGQEGEGFDVPEEGDIESDEEMMPDETMTGDETMDVDVEQVPVEPVEPELPPLGGAGRPKR